MSWEQTTERRGARVGTALQIILGFVALLYVIQAADALTGESLERAGGIEPRATEGLDGIAFAPLLHGTWAHLIANTVPLFVLGFLLLLGGVQRWLAVTAVVWVVGGVGVWLTGPDNSVHIGASVLVFGWLVYLLLRGFFTRHPGQLALGLVLFLVYGGLLWGVLPAQPGISWQGHLFGAIGGGLAAWRLRRDDPPPLP